MKEAEALDVMTSRSSTLPYDDDKMQKMIELVLKAKRTSRSGYDTGLTDSYSEVQKGAGDVGGVEHYNAATSECTPHTCLLQYSHSLVISSPPVVFW